MKKLLLGFLICFSLVTAAAESFLVVACDNQSEIFWEDNLTINYYDKIAIYNPNDQDKVVPCEQLEDVYVCSDNSYTIKIYSDGKAFVLAGKEMNGDLVEFDCKIDE